ncbi:hypothetical protein ES703_23747 [subsurface metagenome]
MGSGGIFFLQGDIFDSGISGGRSFFTPWQIFGKIDRKPSLSAVSHFFWHTVIMEGYPIEGFLPGQRFLTWPLTFLQISISCVSPGSMKHKIWGITAKGAIQSLFTRGNICGPQRPDRIAPWLRFNHPGRPQESLTALRYNQVKDCTGRL